MQTMITGLIVLLVSFAFLFLLFEVGSNTSTVELEAQQSMGRLQSEVDHICLTRSSESTTSLNVKLKGLESVSVVGGDVFVGDIAQNVDCSALSSESTCDDTAGCEWSGGTCQEKTLRQPIRRCSSVGICASELTFWGDLEACANNDNTGGTIDPPKQLEAHYDGSGRVVIGYLPF